MDYTYYSASEPENSDFSSELINNSNLTYSVEFVNPLPKTFESETASNPYEEWKKGLPFLKELFDIGTQVWLKAGHNQFFQATWDGENITNIYSTQGTKNNRTKKAPISLNTLFYVLQKPSTDGLFFGCSDGEAKYPLKEFQKESRDIVAECDNGTTDEQWQKIKHFEEVTGLSLCVISSGGKSLHNHILLSEKIPIERITYYRRLFCLILFADPALPRPHQPYRVPGAYRATKGKYQVLLQMGGKYSEAQLQQAFQTYFEVEWGMSPPTQEQLTDEVWRKLTSLIKAEDKEAIINLLTAPPEVATLKKSKERANAPINAPIPTPTSFDEEICHYYLQAFSDKGWGLPGSGSYNELLPVAGAVQSILGQQNGLDLLRAYFPQRSFGALSGCGMPQLIAGGNRVGIPKPTELFAQWRQKQAELLAPKIEEYGAPLHLIFSLDADEKKKEIILNQYPDCRFIYSPIGYFKKEFLAEQIEGWCGSNQDRQKTLTETKNTLIEAIGDEQYKLFLEFIPLEEKAKKAEENHRTEKYILRLKKKLAALENQLTLTEEQREAIKALESEKEKEYGKIFFNPQNGACLLNEEDMEWGDHYEEKGNHNPRKIKVAALKKCLGEIVGEDKEYFILFRDLLFLSDEKAAEYLATFEGEIPLLKTSKFWAECFKTQDCARYLSNKRFTPDTVLNGNKCTDVVEDIVCLLAEHKNICIKAPLGSGKTELLTILANAYFRDMLLVVGNYRQSLCASQKTRFGIMSDWLLQSKYLDDWDGRNPLSLPFDKQKLLDNPEQDVIGCVDSWLAIEAKTNKPRLCFIDEITSVEQHLLAGKTDISKCRTTKQKRVFDVIQNAQNTIVCDAAPNDKTIQLLEEKTGELWHKVELVTTNEPIKIKLDSNHISNRKGVSFDAIKTNLKNGERVCVQSDSLIYLKSLQEYLNFLNPEEIFYISSENSMENLQISFRNNPNSFIRTNPQYKLYLLSPTIESGVDISLKGVFKHCHIWYSGVVSYHALMQMIMRIRDLACEKILYIDEAYYRLTSEEDIRISIEDTNFEQSATLYLHSKVEEIISQDPAIDPSVKKDLLEKIDKLVLDQKSKNAIFYRRKEVDYDREVEKRYCGFLLPLFLNQNGFICGIEEKYAGVRDEKIKEATFNVLVKEAIAKKTAKTLTDDEYEASKNDPRADKKMQDALFKYKLNKFDFPNIINTPLWGTAFLFYLLKNKDLKKHILRTAYIINSSQIDKKFQKHFESVLQGFTAIEDLKDEILTLKVLKNTLPKTFFTLRSLDVDECTSMVKELASLIRKTRGQSLFLQKLRRYKKDLPMVKALYKYFGYLLTEMETSKGDLFFSLQDMHALCDHRGAYEDGFLSLIDFEAGGDEDWEYPFSLDEYEMLFPPPTYPSESELTEHRVLLEEIGVDTPEKIQEWYMREYMLAYKKTGRLILREKLQDLIEKNWLKVASITEANFNNLAESSSFKNRPQLELAKGFEDFGDFLNPYKKEGKELIFSPSPENTSAYKEQQKQATTIIEEETETKLNNVVISASPSDEPETAPNPLEAFFPLATELFTLAGDFIGVCWGYLKDRLLVLTPSHEEEMWRPDQLRMA